MPVYQVTARDRAGDTRVTTVTAGTEKSAAAVMQERGMFVLDVKRISPLRARSSRDAIRDLVSPVRHEDLALFFRHYAALTHAGFSPPEALTKMGNRLTDERLERFAVEAAGRTRNGQPLSAAMRMRPLMFPAWVTGLVATAEHSGRFDELLEFTHDELTDASEFELSYRLPQTYFRTVVVLSALLTTAGAGVAGGLAGWLLSLLQVFLPVIAVLQVVSWGGCALTRTERGQPLYASLLAALPGIGAMRRALALRRFVRSLRALHEADRSVQDAFLHSLPVVDDPRVAECLAKGAEAVLSGRAFATALDEAGLLGAVSAHDMHGLEGGGKMGDIVQRLVKEHDGALVEATKYAKRTIWIALALLSVAMIGLGGLLGTASLLMGGMSQARSLINGG